MADIKNIVHTSKYIAQQNKTFGFNFNRFGVVVSILELYSYYSIGVWNKLYYYSVCVYGTYIFVFYRYIIK